MSASITSAAFRIWPCFIISLITSTARSAMRLASSWMVIVSGMTTSRMIFSRGPSWARARSRSRRRRIEVSDRARSESSSAVERVSLPRRRSSTRFTGFGSATRVGAVFTRPRRAALRSSSSSPLTAFAAGRRAVAGGCSASGFFSSPRRRRAVSSARARTASSVFRRASSSVLRRSASSRSRARRSASILRRSACSSATRRSSASWTRASASARARASISSSESWRSTRPARGEGFGGEGATVSRVILTVSDGGRGATACGGSGFAVSPGRTIRRFLRSTCTVLVRPCEKLWRTVSRSTPRGFSPSGFRCWGTWMVLSPVLLLSVMYSLASPRTCCLTSLRTKAHRQQS
jgi:hypothetical protein